MCEKYHKLPSEIEAEPAHEFMKMQAVAALHSPSVAEEIDVG